MEDRAANENLNLSVTTDRDELEEETLSRVFSQLKPYCLDILQLVQNPKSKANSVSELYQFLRETPSQYLQPFFDYALFPMLLLLDAAVGCRNPQNVDSGGKFGMPNMSNMTHSISDSVAEVGLLCLEELLRKCHLGSVNQMVVVLKKLTYGALLSPSDAAEEFREGIVKCLRALLLSLQHCSGKSCSCKDIIEVPTFLDSHTSENTHTTCLNYRTEADKCLLAFLQSENASAAVGHWLSLLLKIADTEVARGHRGSSKLRVEAFFTLRLLVSKVGTADALAFFLPGVVSQFAKVFHLSKTMISGAAGSTDSIDQAVRGLSEFLTIVLEDEANISGLSMSVNDITGLYPNNDNSTQSFLERLRHLSGNAPDLHGKISGSSNDQAGGVVTLRSDFKEKNCSTSNVNMGSLQVSRTKDWIGETSIHVDKLLSTTFPHLCVHPAKKVRRGLIEAIRGLLLKCRYTLKKSRLMLLECLCVLVCDDFEEVSVAAQELLDSFFILSEKHLIDSEISEIFNRLIQKLPKVVLGNDKTFALSHAQQLLAVMYYAGPQLVVNHLLQSPVTAAHFLDAIAQCLNQNSVYAGSLEKFILKKPVSVGYLHSIAELKAGPRLEVFKTRSSQENKLQDLVEAVCQDYLVPQMPPWFFYVGSEKLYETLAGILRLVGLSTMADTRSGVSLSVIIDIPLSYLRKLISEVQMKGYSKESWQSWYTRSTSGQLLRQASTAVCVLNEIIYGLSDQSINLYARKFCLSRMNGKDMQEHVWNVCQKDAKEHLANCIGSILHEYLSPELWDLPVGQKASILEMDNEAGNMKLHFFRDTEMLQQVIINGLGVFTVCLGKDFTSKGFLHSSLYLLLEKLICSSSQIRRASDAVLHVISVSSGYPNVGKLVLANADYVIDSLCRQLRHLDLNPHVPNVLAAMLSSVGVANDILPLLEEPLRSVSLELEVLGRHQHPDLTIPFLKAVAEIVKASKHESYTMSTQAESYYMNVKLKLSDMKSENAHFDNCNADIQLEHWEEMLFKLNESRRYRRTVGSVTGSCLIATTPLVSSVKEAACLVALDIIEDGITALAKVEEAYAHESKTKGAILRAIQMGSFHDLQDALEATDEGTDENRLLPAVNKIWPYLVVCIKNKNPMTTRRCLGVVSSVVQISGGDFFSRRFHNDGPHFWKILATSPFQKKPISRDETTPLRLPYRANSNLSEESTAETATLKTQTAALHMIADLSKNKKSAPALEAVLKKVSGLVVGIACSSVVGLRNASINALTGLSCIDSDLIWLLLADVYFSLKKKKDVPSPPMTDLPEMSQLLPSPTYPKEYLYLQYGGESFGFGVDSLSVEIVFKKLQLVLESQLFRNVW